MARGGCFADSVRTSLQSMTHPTEDLRWLPTAGSRWGPVLTTKQAAEYVGLKPQTLRRMKCEGTGPKSFKQGRLNVYYPADLDAWLQRRLTPA